MFGVQSINEFDNENWKSDKQKRKNFLENVTNAAKLGISITSAKKEKDLESIEKTEKAPVEENNHLVLCTINKDIKLIKQKANEAQISAYVKPPIPQTTQLSSTQEMRMMCTMDDDSFFTFSEYKCISNIYSSC